MNQQDAFERNAIPSDHKSSTVRTARKPTPWLTLFAISSPIDCSETRTHPPFVWNRTRPNYNAFQLLCAQDLHRIDTDRSPSRDRRCHDGGTSEE